MYDDKIALFEEFYGRYLVQGVIDKVNAYISNQQAFAEAAEAAAKLAKEEAAAAVLAATEAVAESAAARLAADEAAAVEQANAEAAKLAAAEAAASERNADSVTLGLTATPGNWHFLEIIFIICISAAVATMRSRRKKKNDARTR